MALTVHSLEPLRPWKREQLGYGYDGSSWLERTASWATIAAETKKMYESLRS
jgi:alpha-maltose-1-phosphate synthase